MCVASGGCLFLVKGCCSRTCGEVEIEMAVLSNPSCLIAFASVLSFHLAPAPLSFSHSLTVSSHKAPLIKHTAKSSGLRTSCSPSLGKHWDDTLHEQINEVSSCNHRAKCFYCSLFSPLSCGGTPRPHPAQIRQNTTLLLPKGIFSFL